MSETQMVPFMPAGMPGMPIMTPTTAVQVVTNGVTQFRFDPAFPQATTTVSLDPEVAAATEAALEAALSKARAITAAFRTLAGSSAP